MPRTAALDKLQNMEELLDHLGGIEPRRVRLHPPPGKATEKDLLRILDRTNVICELVDGVLVEKVMGFQEGQLALWIGHLLQLYLDEHDVGTLAGADSTGQIMPHLVRIPDVAFIRWEKLPERCYPTEPVPELVPDLAVEVLSEGNTTGEMARKRREYFLAGVSLVWEVDPRKLIVSVYSLPDQPVVFTEADTLDAGTLLPGLSLPVARIFQRVRRQETPSKTRAKPKKKGSR
jgi:Uma2 family endonuclease